MQIVTNTDIIEFPLVHRGKVRDIYDIDDKTLLLVTTDRMSAFDVIMNSPIPYKGVVLNQITLFWMEKFKHIVPNQILESDVSKFPKALAPYASALEGRAILAKKAKPLPIECIVRGHITGSGWLDYIAQGVVCGHTLPQGLEESERLSTPLFTPSTKAELGAHDENITIDIARTLMDPALVDRVAEISLNIFDAARVYAEQRGIIIADTKFEFGMVDGELTLIDEVLTPDSSRFWAQDQYTLGKSQPSFDKQFLRDWLKTQNWNKQAPPPDLPQRIIDTTRDKYFEAYRILTGTSLNI